MKEQICQKEKNNKCSLPSCPFPLVPLLPPLHSRIIPFFLITSPLPSQSLPSILIHLLSSISSQPCPGSSLFPRHSPSPLIPGPFCPLGSRYLSPHPSAILTLHINPPSPSLILSYLFHHRSSSSLLATPLFLSTHI
jgi:hypothetical protein